MYDSFATDNSAADTTMVGARQKLARHRRNRLILRLIVVVCSIISGALVKSHPIVSLPFSLICICAAVALIVEVVRSRMTVRAIKAAGRASVSPLTSVYR